jgi:hypothetical protein
VSVTTAPPCDICGSTEQKRRAVTDADRQRLPDLAPFVRTLCRNCLKVRLQAREREAIVSSRNAERRARARR